ncbi:MAG: hypothetical protein WBP93_06535 [Pyrinomonadaceae bacterium]
MTQQQFLEAIKQLSISERIALIEEISRSLLEDFKSYQASGSNTSPNPDEADARDTNEHKIPLSQRLYGILKFDGDPPDDEGVKDAYADYLMEKYS